MPTRLYNSNLQLDSADMNSVELAYLLSQIPQNIVTLTITPTSTGVTISADKYQDLIDIRYNTDGTNPTSSSTLYVSGEIPFTDFSTIVVQAFKGDDTVSETSSYKSNVRNWTVGQQITCEDGTEATVVYDAGSDQSWGRYLVVDNHGMGYYFNNQEDTSDTAKVYNYGAYSYYEPSNSNITSSYYSWAETIYGSDVDWASTTNIGDGLELSNRRAARAGYWAHMNNLEVESGSAFKDLMKIRAQRKNSEWFIPTPTELTYVYNNKTSVPNLKDDRYLTSVENSSRNTTYFNMTDGSNQATYKYSYACPVRLMRAYSYMDTKVASPAILRNNPSSATGPATVEITCEDPNATIYYTTNSTDPTTSSSRYSSPLSFTSYNTTDLRAIAVVSGKDNSSVSNLQYKRVDIGDEITKNNIPSVCIYSSETSLSWGHYLWADKNHDLIYYFANTDYCNERESSSIINTSYKYGYEWGGYNTDCGLQDIQYRQLGKGESNSNSLISRNPPAYNSGWYTVWNRLSSFRSSRSNDWFVPSSQEASCMANSSGLMNNISHSTSQYYWSSSEIPYDYIAYFVNMNSGAWDYYIKLYRYLRVRLCWGS